MIENSISPIVRGITANKICDIADLARDDPEVIKLWIGEGDLPTPDFIKQAAWKALQNGHTRYTYALGVPELRKAIARYHKRHWDVDVSYERISVTAGGNQAIVQAIQSLFSEGEELIIPTPAWPNSMEIAKITHAKVVEVPMKNRANGEFYLELDDIANAITPKTKAVMINSPSNPTGWEMPWEDMVKLSEILKERDLFLISDEVYNHFVYDKKISPSFLELYKPDEKLLLTNTFSKNWSMTGWRAGWIIFPVGMEACFDNLSQYATTSIATFIQHACIDALDHGDDFIRKQVARCKRSRDILYEGLSAMDNVSVACPKGSFYMLFKPKSSLPSFELAEKILREAKVGLAPGIAFTEAGEGYLRLCFAIDEDLAKEALARLKTVL